MSTAARKARKRAGIPFSKPAKVGTPPEERSYVNGTVPGPAGTKHDGMPRSRSTKKVARFLERFSKPEPTAE